MWPFPSGVEPKLIVDRIVSLGALCEVAYQARRLSKSSRAYPFDWWDTPLPGVLKVLETGSAAVFSVPHIVKLPREAGALPAFYSSLSGTVHQHEIPRGEDVLALDEAEISRRLVPKYTALHARLVADCSTGATLFVRQRKPVNDPDGAALEEYDRRAARGALGLRTRLQAAFRRPCTGRRTAVADPGAGPAPRRLDRSRLEPGLGRDVPEPRHSLPELGRSFPVR